MITVSLRTHKSEIVDFGSGHPKSRRTLGYREAGELLIPVLGSIAAGAPNSNAQDEDGCIRVDLDSITLPRNARIFALRVRGQSMTGAGIFDKDYVILEFKPPYDGAIVAALVDGETTLKRYVLRGGRPYLKAENPRFKNIIPAHELVIQGVLVALVRKPLH